MNCAVEGCEKEAREGPLCFACGRYARRTGKSPHGRKRHERHPNPRAMVLEAVYALVDVDAANGIEWHRAWRRFLMATLRYRRARNRVRKRPETLIRG